MSEGNELLENLCRLRTTELGAVRVKKNLSLDADDAVEWCRQAILSPDAVISRHGKNWYIDTKGCIITVNAFSYTIITAHRK